MFKLSFGKLCLCALLAACAAVAQAQTFAAPANSEITQAMVDANTRIILPPGACFITQDILIPAGKTLTISGSASVDVPTGIVLNLRNFGIDVGNTAKLTLDSLSLEGGSTISIAVPAGATFRAGRVAFNNPSTNIRLAGGSVDVGSSIFTRGRAIVQDSGRANIVQSTFIGTQGLIHNGGILNLVANLFADSVDAPKTNVASTTTNQMNWYSNLTGADNTAAAGANDQSQAATPPGGIIVYATTGWAGKLDPFAQLPLLSNAPTSDSALSSILDSTRDLRTTDFDNQVRGPNPLQVGADELGPTAILRNGWISGAISTGVVGNVGGSTLSIAGASDAVEIVVEVGSAIDITTADMIIVPQLSSIGVPESIAEFPIDVDANDISRGTVRFNSPSSACLNGYMWDGRAEIFIRTEDGTIHDGDTYQLGIPEHFFLIDTTAPQIAPSIAPQYLSTIINATGDPALQPSPATGDAFPADWGPRAMGRTPSNSATLAGEGNNPTAFFNWDLGMAARFALPMQYIDPIPGACDRTTGNTGTPEISGFDSTALPVDQTHADGFDALFEPQATGQPYLVGTPTFELSSSLTFSQSSTVSASVAPNDFAVATWQFNDFAYNPSGWYTQLQPRITDIAGNIVVDPITFEAPKPLELWWLIIDQLTRANIGLSGPDDPEDPVFSWQLNRPKDPERAISVPCLPLVTYRLWAAEDNADEYSPFDAVSDWSGWTDTMLIDRSTPFRVGPRTEVLEELLVANQGNTMLLTIMVADEAGNLQESVLASTVYSNQVRSTRIVNLLDPNLNSTVPESIDDEGVVAFARWGNVQELGDEVDTRLRAKLFWNRVFPLGPNRVSEGDIRSVENRNATERDFGSSTRIPLPPENCPGANFDGEYARVEAQFTVKAEVDSPSAELFRRVSWEFLQDGKAIASGTVEVYPDTGFRGVVQIPEDLVRGGVSESEAIDEYGYRFIVTVDPTTLNRTALQTSGCAEIRADGSARKFDRLGDEGTDAEGRRRRNIKYLFRASTVYEGDPLTSGDEVLDSTPATFQFTVTPGDEFETGENPVKIFAPR